MKKIPAMILLAAAMLVFICAPSYAMSEEDSYLQAMDLYNQKDFEKAKPLLQDFYNNFKDSKYRPNVMLKLAELETDFSKEEGMYKDIIKEKPDTEFEAEAVYSLGRLYFARDEYRKCEEYMGMVLGKFNNTVWIEPAYHYLMLSLNAQKKYDETAKLYSDYDGNKSFYMFRNRVKQAYADSLYLTAKYQEAGKLYREIISDSSNEKYIYMPIVYARLISCLDNQGNSSEKDNFLYDLRQKFPDSPEAKAGENIKAPGAAAEQTAVEPDKTDADRIPPVPVAKKGVAAKSGVFYTIQIGAYANKKFAEFDAGKLKKKKYDVFMKADGKLTKVMVGKFPTKSEAEALAQELTKKGTIKSYLVKQAWE
jgi:tetratricopeptide (TPR) repeat protein